MKPDKYRYVVSRFDIETFVVIDCKANREICICGDYDDYEDAEMWAEKIADALNILSQ